MKESRWRTLHTAMRVIRMRSRTRVSAAVIASLTAGLAGACTTPVGLPAVPRLSTPEIGEAPTLPPYKLQVGDTLDIKFPLNPELDEQVTVAPDGNISTSFLPSVPAYGNTVDQLTASLIAGYKADLKDPRLSVILRTSAPNRVYVLGEVSSPGEFITVGPNLTVSQAVSRAGGLKLSADRSKVFVMRRGANDKAEAFAVDYSGIITGRDPAADVRLAQYDVLYVPRLGAADAYQYVDQYLLQFVPVGATATFLP